MLVRLAPLAFVALAACGADGTPVPPTGAAAADRALRPAGAPATSPTVTIGGEARAGVVFSE